MSAEPDHDVIIVGAGIAGIYGMIRLRNQGLRVRGIEGAPDVGGVWYHNGYPGARVDVESINYCYVFDKDLYRESPFDERFAAQPELLAYLNDVADRFDVRKDFLFNTWITSAVWNADDQIWVITTEDGRTHTARYFVTASGQLSKARTPDFPGLSDFQGEWYQTSHWPHEPVQLEGRRIAVIGTGSTGVQSATAASRVAAHTYVFQRTPHFVIPANNHPADKAKHARLAEKFEDFRSELMSSGAGILLPPAAGKARDFSEEEVQLLLEQRFAFGGQSFLALFTETGVDEEVNQVVSEFVRHQIRLKVHDPATAEKLMPRDYPIGVRRPCFDTGYYESFNLPNVDLVDIVSDPIDRITPTGIQLASGAHYEVDLIILALGFESFTGSLDAMNIRNEDGAAPTDNWTHGPRTYLGMMTTGFPNLFNITGPGSPSVLGNFFVHNPQQLDFIADLLSYMQARGKVQVEPTVEAEDAWTQHSADVAEPLLRRVVENYMTHVNEDGTKVFIPYAGGFGAYVAKCDEVAANGFEGFALS